MERKKKGHRRDSANLEHRKAAAFTAVSTEEEKEEKKKGASQARFKKRCGSASQRRQA